MVLGARGLFCFGAFHRVSLCYGSPVTAPQVKGSAAVKFLHHLFNMHLTQDLELYPDRRVTQILFKDVKNASELRQSAVDGKVNGALINPTMLLSPFQVMVAANKAVHLQKTGNMKTRSLFSEIIFNLSPTNKISEAFKRFGISDGDSSVLVVLVHTQDDPPPLSDITALVDGSQVPVEDVSSLSDTAKIKKLYKITPQEEKIGTLLDAVVCRMAIKDVL